MRLDVALGLSARIMPATTRAQKSATTDVRIGVLSEPQGVTGDEDAAQEAAELIRSRTRRSSART
jgi:hypothetical protein